MVKPLLIEIGVEELPAVPLLKELAEIEKKWVNVLEKNGLLCEFEFYYTPRRLVLWHREFKTAQEDRIEEFYGAPVEMAIKDGVATPAALGFAKKCGVDFEQLSRSEKAGKEVLYYSKNVEGKESSVLLNEMINQWIKSLNFGKSMRWGSNTESFIRPIRWLNVMLGEKQVDAELFGVKSAPETYVHRISHFEAKPLGSLHEYFDVLKNGSVTLFPQERRSTILEAFKNLENEHGITIEIDEDLLDEVVAITEHPTPLLGKFDESFLELPPEVIVTSMKEHQRYFPVFKEGKLINAFVVVSNALADDFTQVIEGNERVLRPRLSDALFFYHNDLKKGLSTAGLEKVVFMNGLGTLAEKIKREKIVAKKLLSESRIWGLFLDDDYAEEHLEEAMTLAKADLMSEMVYEFTELQGLMGSYYFKKLYPEKGSRIVEAIKEQYKFSGEEISSSFSAIVNIAMKLDTLIGMFSIGEIPTGSRDPFALRRAVNGIISIALKHKIPLDFSTFIDSVQEFYPQNIDYKKNIEQFIIERLSGIYPNVNSSIIQSVVVKKEGIFLDIRVVDLRIKAVDEIASSDGFEEIFSTFKRVCNILKDDSDDNLFPDIDLFEHEAEHILWNKLVEVINNKDSYGLMIKYLDALFALKAPLDSFFENVMVNTEDLLVRANRKTLLRKIYAEIYSIADIKNITL
ncbi:MAG: glycine--tRNA ligase subunit beta [Pseudomonadota bacterium]